MDGLDSTTGVIALAAALLALLLAASTAFRVRRLRKDQLVVLGETRQEDLVAHAARTSGRMDSLERALQAAVDTLVKRAAANEVDLRQSVAHTAVIRYDALNEGSGRQSSSIALLDRSGYGVVISSIHQRDQARVYAKPVEDWRSEYDLSPEEQEALDAAAARGVNHEERLR